MGVLFFILFILLFILIIASSVIVSIIRGVLSFLGLTKKGGRSYTGTYSNSNGSTSDTRQRSSENGAWDGRHNNTETSGWHYSPEAEYKRRNRKKIIEENEGEYVDFEEIK